MLRTLLFINPLLHIIILRFFGLVLPLSGIDKWYKRTELLTARCLRQLWDVDAKCGGFYSRQPRRTLMVTKVYLRQEGYGVWSSV